MKISMVLKSVAMRFPAPKTLLVVAPNIFLGLDEELVTPVYVSIPSSSAQMSWRGISLAPMTVLADAILPDNQINVFTQGPPQSVSVFLGNIPALVSTTASYPA